MRFLLYIQNTKRFSPHDTPLIKSIVETESARAQIAGFLIKNIRVSSTEIQLDFFIQGNDRREVQEAVATRVAGYLENDLGSLNERINLSEDLTAGLDESSIIEKVVRSFDKQRYWEAQETAEAIWKRSNNPDEKDVIQGLILVGAALVHHQRNEDQVCLSMLGRALNKLSAFDRIPIERRSFLLIDIESLRADVQAILKEGTVRDVSLKQDPNFLR